jgi:hypothetical protein
MMIRVREMRHRLRSAPNLQTPRRDFFRIPEAQVLTLECLTCSLPTLHPFQDPRDEDIFGLQDQQRSQRAELAERLKKLSVQEKTTFSSKMQATVTPFDPTNAPEQSARRKNILYRQGHGSG